MLHRAWQSTMIRFARSARLTSFMQRNRATSLMARKFVAGRDAAQAVKLAGAPPPIFAPRSMPGAAYGW